MRQCQGTSVFLRANVVVAVVFRLVRELLFTRQNATSAYSRLAPPFPYCFHTEQLMCEARRQDELVCRGEGEGGKCCCRSGRVLSTTMQRIIVALVTMASTPSMLWVILQGVIMMVERGLESTRCVCVCRGETRGRCLCYLYGRWHGALKFIMKR